MTSLKFSIIIPSYNQGKFIEQTLESIISQEYENVEIIVIDGGSSDGTVGILEKYSSHIAYWQSTPDNGQAHAIAIGFSLATGDVLSWLNSDDVYYPLAFKEVNAKFLESNAEVVYGNMYLINETGRVVGERYLTQFLPEFLRDAYFCGGFGIYQPASFWRRNLYDRSGGIDITMKFCMDNDLFNKFVMKNAKFYFLDRMLAAFRIHSSSKTSSQQDVAEYERSIIYKKYIEDMEIKMPRLKRLMARIYRVLMLIKSRRILRVLKMRYFDNLKWVP